MSSGLKLQALRTVLDEFLWKLSETPYVPKARDNLVATGEVQVALSMRYLQNVRGHRR